jgi:hypothetical protein
MKRYLAALLFAACGGILLREGWVAAHSISGTMDYYSKGIAYKIGGHVRLPGFVITFIGGILFVFAGWWVLRGSNGRKPSRRKRRA